MNKYLPYAHSFNEELLARELFVLKEAKVKSIVSYNIRNHSFVTVLSLVSRYLLHIEKLSANKTREYLRKYAVIICYLYLSSVNGITFNFKSPALDNILLDINTVALEGKLDEKSIFANLYNDIDYNSNLKALLKKIKHDKKDKQEDDIYRVLRGEFNYFSPKTNVNYFTQYPDMRRFDMIVAEALLIPSFYSFNFSVNIEEFKANFIDENPSDEQIRMAIIFVGYMVYDIFNNSNFKFKKDINYLQNKMFVLACLNKDVSENKMNLGFLYKDGGQVIIDWQELKEFHFIYNEIEATFKYKKIDYSML